MRHTGQHQLRRGQWETVGRVAALLVALAGLFAMHGLADHGISAHGAMPGMTASVADGSAALTSTGHEVRAVATSTLAETAPANDHSSTMDMLGLCLAIVGGLFAFVAAALLRRERPALSAWLPAWKPDEFWWARARDPAPPDLIRLSIQRC